VHGIKTAVRRLEFAPEARDMEVSDITNGRFVFKPRPDKPVSLEGLRKAVKKAGYEVEGTWIEVTGTLTSDGRLRVPDTGQVFRLEGEKEGEKKAGSGDQVTVAGAWKTVDGEEVVSLRERHP
jgi:hypothetical protein